MCKMGNSEYKPCSSLSVTLANLKTISNDELVSWLRQNFISNKNFNSVIETLEDPILVTKVKSYSRTNSQLFIHITFFDPGTQSLVYRS